MENIYWKKTVGTLISSIWIYTLAGIAASITGVANAILNPSGLIGMLDDIMGGGNSTPTLSMGDIIEGLFSMLVVVGYYLFFSSLTRFAHLQSNEQDSENVSTVRVAYILLMVAIFVDIIPMIGWLVSFILMIVSYVKMLSGYRGLKKSVTFPLEARGGASTLYSCTIWTLVGSVLGCIPIIGGVIEGTITLVVFFTVLAAWGRIKAGAPTMTSEEEVAFVRDEVPADKQMLGDGLIAIFFVLLISSLLRGVKSYFPMPSGNDASLLYMEIFNFFPMIVLGGIYIWLLSSSKIRLNIVSRIGLGLLVLECIIQIIIVCFSLRNFVTLEHVYVAERLGNVSSILWLVGFILFIWKAQVNCAIKIVVTLFPLLSLFFWYFLWGLALRRYEESGYTSDLQTIDFVYSNIWLGVGAIFFIVVYVLVAKWKKQADNEVPLQPLT